MEEPSGSPSGPSRPAPPHKSSVRTQICTCPLNSPRTNFRCFVLRKKCKPRSSMLQFFLLLSRNFQFLPHFLLNSSFLRVICKRWQLCWPQWFNVHHQVLVPKPLPMYWSPTPNCPPFIPLHLPLHPAHFTVPCLLSLNPPEAKQRSVIALRQTYDMIDQTLPPE